MIPDTNERLKMTIPTRFLLPQRQITMFRILPLLQTAFLAASLTATAQDKENKGPLAALA